MLGLAERVAESGDVLNVAECLEVEKGSGGNIKSLLAMPIRNRHYQIIGNRSNVHVTRSSTNICLFKNDVFVLFALCIITSG
jgi:hypothetical protein